ncbi:MAG: hypothetical protein ACK4IX_01035 [Candidatus Sericytochromatia bacterium]
MEEENSFNISRLTLGLELFDKANNTNDHIYEIKNCSLNLEECKKYLNFSEQQIKNAIEMNLLISVQFANQNFFCIRSVLKIKSSKIIKEKILSQDNLNEAYIAKYLNLSPRNIKRLVSEGYLNYISNENRYIKREEVEEVKSHLEEIKNFWKAKNKINRQLGAKKASKIRQEINKKSDFRDLFLKSIESYPYKESKLLQTAFNLVALSYYIDRKSKRNIIDNSLIELFNKSIESFILKYKNSKFMRIYFLKSDKTFIKYCDKCKEKILKSPFYSNQVCNNCEIDYDFKSLVLISISILEYSFNLYVGYKKIKSLLESNNIEIALLSPCSKIEDQAFISSLIVSDEDINSFKIFQVTEFLENFIKLREPDFLY